MQWLRMHFLVLRKGWLGWQSAGLGVYQGYLTNLRLSVRLSVVSNCTMGLFWVAIVFSIGYYKVVQKTGLKFVNSALCKHFVLKKSVPFFLHWIKYLESVSLDLTIILVLCSLPQPQLSSNWYIIFVKLSVKYKKPGRPLRDKMLIDLPQKMSTVWNTSTHQVQVQVHQTSYPLDRLVYTSQLELLSWKAPHYRTCTAMGTDQCNCHRLNHKVYTLDLLLLRRNHLDKKPCIHPCVEITSGYLWLHILCRHLHRLHCNFCKMGDKSGIVLLRRHTSLHHISSHIDQGHACTLMCMKCRQLHCQHMSDTWSHILHRSRQNLAHVWMCHQDKSLHSFHCAGLVEEYKRDNLMCWVRDKLHMCDCMACKAFQQHLDTLTWSNQQHTPTVEKNIYITIKS